MIRALAAEAAASPGGRVEPSEPLTWAAFHAMRDGVDAEVLEDGRRVPLRELAETTVARIRPFARDLGDEEALEGVRRIVAEGGGASRRRRAFAAGGMPGQLEELVRETAAAYGSGASIGGSLRDSARPSR